MKLAETGKIRDIKKIIARIDGLPSCLSGQLVDAGGGVKGIVMGFNAEDVLVLVLGDENKLRIGQEVSGVNEPFTIPVGEKFLGRMIDTLGEARDRGPVLVPDGRRPVFRDSPSITDRSPVEDFLQSGTKVIDMFIPLGKGQRQLIVGDRMSGKTVLALDAIISQKGRNVVCIYCCIGKSMSALEKVVTALKEGGALAYTVIMIALDNAPVGEQYLLPYAGAAMGDYFMEKGRDVLVVFDDLTKHAWSYRQLSLLLERPPGREAYPGDIFYIHTQLMERAGRMSKAKGGGSMTFLGVAETLEGDLTGYIPSNLISMCDGLVFVSGAIFGEGLRPAVDFMQSVSIVGGRAQPLALRTLSATLRVQYAQYTEVVKLSKLQASVSGEALRVIRRGEAIRAALQQPQFHPVSLAEEVILLYAVERGKLDEMSDEERKTFRDNIFGFARERNQRLVADLGDKPTLTPELRKGLDAILAAYSAAYGAVGGDKAEKAGSG